MRYNELFDRKALNLMAVAKRGAISGRKPAITTFMVAKAIIINEEDASRVIFNEMQVDMGNFYRMANKRIEEMPSVSEPCPYVDDELDGEVRESAMHDAEGNFVAESVTAESMLRNILDLHRNECDEYVREEEENGSTPTQSHDILERYSTDWTSLAADGLIAPVIGRENELTAIQRSLLRKSKNNPVLIGDAGTGKTAIVEGLAVKIAQGDVHQKLRSKKILALNITSLLEEAGLGGFKDALDTASKTDDVILFVDEIHALPKGALDVLKPFMARGELKLIGATTAEEYSRFLESDKAFARRLQKIDIPELSEKETLHVLQEIKGSYETHHGISIGNDALLAAVSLSQRYVTNRCQPDKSIDLIDEAAAKVRMAGMSGPVCEDDIREVLSKRTGIPVEKIGKDEAARLINMEQHLCKEVMGQSEAVSAVAKVVRRNSVGLSDAHRPTASFMFVGPSGVGKTALAQALSKNLMGSNDALLRIDMSEYQQPFSVSRLIGSPPGYVGYQTGGQLTEAVSRRPYCVVLFDEIEKAYPAVFELLLQVLDYGRLTDGRGRSVDFTNTIVIFTSNLGAEDNASDDTAIRDFFTPEFLNRLDGIVHFNRLEAPILLDIANKMLAELSEDLKQKEYFIKFDRSVAEFIIGIDAGLGQGARFIRRAIEQNITDVIVPQILSGELAKNKRITLSVTNGRININEDRH